jgi:hypothetical protein
MVGMDAGQVEPDHQEQQQDEREGKEDRTGGTPRSPTGGQGPSLVIRVGIARQISHTGSFVGGRRPRTLSIHFVYVKT